MRTCVRLCFVVLVVESKTKSGEELSRCHLDSRQPVPRSASFPGGAGEAEAEFGGPGAESGQLPGYVGGHGQAQDGDFLPQGLAARFKCEQCYVTVWIRFVCMPI